jgi:hypothetical protein
MRRNLTIVTVLLASLVSLHAGLHKPGFSDHTMLWLSSDYGG